MKVSICLIGTRSDADVHIVETIVAMSGKTDYVSDGWTVVAIENGHEYQGEITGSGCMCSASIACHMTAMKGLENAFVATVAG